MKCARCEKEFLFEFLSVQKWLQRSKLDNWQLSFLLYNFGGPVCPECEVDLQDRFYRSATNPYRKNLVSTK